jgi:hypothetical protein
MAKDHSTDKNRLIKTLKDHQASSPPCQNCVIFTLTMDTTPYQLAGIG